jgi:hypothetical protein
MQVRGLAKAQVNATVSWSMRVLRGTLMAHHRRPGKWDAVKVPFRRSGLKESIRRVLAPNNAEAKSRDGQWGKGNHREHLRAKAKRTKGKLRRRPGSDAPIDSERPRLFPGLLRVL